MVDVNSKLPLVISVPHGGVMIPTHLIKKCLLSKAEILLDCDTWSHELYKFKELVEEFVDTPIARIVIDMNREKSDFPPYNPDGVVKTQSVVEKSVWNSPGGLTTSEIQQLFTNYYTIYHRKLEAASSNPNVVLGIDCHTMLDVGPVPGQSNWEKRPLFCLGNRGSDTGQPVGEPITAPTELMIKFKQLLESKFKNYASPNENVPLVTLNQPFAGGYITKYHGNKGNIPWIQLEINRRLYLPGSVDKMPILPSKKDVAKMRSIRNELYDVFKELLKEL
ncbi:N-formylglutamate amidohydrolase [Alkalihalobacterium alkalinitrilicum]|uniref:N-formylglutamate amidohydrolase n=1 Tax=Alkalihalobacterium alkalinitrilicum TaxID=427920 RepID=UPI000994E55F|nr:N-formylglutamate amidohydrolase [Alkalihalobacterium alkalinitrilicum]